VPEDPIPLTVSKRLLNRLASGGSEAVKGLIEGVDRDVVADAFADLVDGTDDSRALINHFVSAFWESGIESAERRRRAGLDTPAKGNEVSEHSGARRKTFKDCFDLIPGHSLVLLVTEAFGGSSPPARERAAVRLIAWRKDTGATADPSSKERIVMDRALHEIGAKTAVQRIRSARLLTEAAKAIIEESVAEARRDSIVWREIAEALDSNEDATKRKYRDR
jgi:hypothetical protein